LVLELRVVELEISVATKRPEGAIPEHLGYREAMRGGRSS
jgi:hypothetical protein